MDYADALRGCTDNGADPEVLFCAADEIDRLRALVVECRSSVKFDLNRYERMALDYGRLGQEGAQIHATAEAGAQRLHELLEKIDALTPTTPNA